MQGKIHRNFTLRRFRALDHLPSNNSKTYEYFHSFNDFNSEIISSWVDQQTDVTGVSTGWKGLDDLYRVRFVRRRFWRKCGATIAAGVFLSLNATDR